MADIRHRVGIAAPTFFLLGLKAGLEGGKATPYPGELKSAAGADVPDG
jgi:hypothetical protein